jgi:hypothetical protein
VSGKARKIHGGAGNYKNVKTNIPLHEERVALLNHGEPSRNSLEQLTQFYESCPPHIRKSFTVATTPAGRQRNPSGEFDETTPAGRRTLQRRSVEISKLCGGDAVGQLAKMVSSGLVPKEELSALLEVVQGALSKLDPKALSNIGVTFAKPLAIGEALEMKLETGMSHTAYSTLKRILPKGTGNSLQFCCVGARRNHQSKT